MCIIGTRSISGKALAERHEVIKRYEAGLQVARAGGRG
jgi:hypothetical protein